MDLREWLERVLVHGESVQAEAPDLGTLRSREIQTLLESAYDRHAANVAGPKPTFDSRVARNAAGILAEACWFQSSGAEFAPAADWACEPRTAGDHLSGDLLFRFLPGVRKRAVARDREGMLVKSIEALLRKWPLSGVLADLEGSRSSSTEFGGHAGLQMLYAERLLLNPRAGWVPKAGDAYEWVERVFQEAGKPIPAVPAQENSLE